MKIIREKTTLVQASELRTKLDEVLLQLGSSRVILEKHHKPVAVLIDPKEYEQIEEALEQFSDLLLALEAKKREQKASNNNYIDLESVEKQFLP